MYIDGNVKGPFGERRKISGMPTLLFTLSSVIKDIRKSITMDAKFPGDLVYVIGETKNELGGGEYYQMMEELGLNVPKVDVKEVWPLYLSLHEAIEQELISSAHAITKGGLAVHMAMTAMGGELGMEIHLGSVPSGDLLSDTQLLYSESAGRIVVTVNPIKKEAFEKIFEEMKIGKAGFITESPLFRVWDRNGDLIIEEEIFRLKDCWKRPFGELI